jgi:acyl-CoA thioesterase-1
MIKKKLKDWLMRGFFCTLLFCFTLSAQASILVLGDSLSSAYGMEEHQGWVSMLQTKASSCTPYPEVINASVSGQTTADALASLPSLLAENRPEVVLIALGGNDGLQRKDINQIEKNLKEIVKQSKQANAEVLLIEMKVPPLYSSKYSREFNKIYHKIAKQCKVTLIPPFPENSATLDDLTIMRQEDMIHPSPEAQMHICQHIWPHIRSVIACE